MSGLLDVELVRVPRRFVDEAHAHLRRAGRQGLEGFALWAGVRSGLAFEVRATRIPAQTALWLSGGVCVTVGGGELHRLNVWLFQQGLTLIAQLHSHPAEAYHSDTDDAFPIATTTGALSIVVPDFAREPFSLARCVVYRLIPPRGWVRLDGAAAVKLVTIVD